MWLWVALVPLLGPLAYARLDLVPAVATIWAVERASARSWFGVGGALGFGVPAKLYPVVLVPAALIVAPRRRRFVAGAILFVLLPLLPLVGALPELSRYGAAGQIGRRIHIESIWGSVLLLGNRLGHATPVGSGFSTLHFEGGLPDAMWLLSIVLTVAVIVAACWLARHAEDHDRVPWLAAVMFAPLATIVGVGAVFSPSTSSGSSGRGRRLPP